MIAFEKLTNIRLLLNKRNNLLLGFAGGKTLEDKKLSQSEIAEFDFVQAQEVSFAKFVFILFFELYDLLAKFIGGEREMVTRLQFEVLA